MTDVSHTYWAHCCELRVCDTFDIPTFAISIVDILTFRHYDCRHFYRRHCDLPLTVLSQASQGPNFAFQNLGSQFPAMFKCIQQNNCTYWGTFMKLKKNHLCNGKTKDAKKPCKDPELP